MTIRFTKGRNKPDSLTCLRDDGSHTWSPSGVGTPHDLLHYAVEMVLGYRSAFYGLVAQGRDIADFGTRNGVKDSYPVEAQWTEVIVSFLQAEMLTGEETPLAEFAAMMTRQLPSLPPPEGLTDEMLHGMRARAREHLARWRGVAPGETMELVFPG